MEGEKLGWQPEAVNAPADYADCRLLDADDSVLDEGAVP